MGAFTPPLTIDSAGDAFRAWFNAGIPANISTMYFDMYPDWDSADFISEEITWTITGGQPALWTLNPAGQTPKPGGFVLGASRAAVGGAGTSCNLQGVCSSGRIINVAINMAQYFAVAFTEAGQTTEYVAGSTFPVSGWCNYGSGTARTATLFVDEGQGYQMAAQQTANATGSSLLASFSFPYTFRKACKAFIRMQDTFGRWQDTGEAFFNVKPVSNFTVSTTPGDVALGATEAAPDNIRLNIIAVGARDFKVATTPPSSSNIPGLPVGYNTDGGITTTKVVITPSAADDHMFKVTVPSNAAANTSGKLQLNMNGFNKIVDVVVSSPFPKAPATGIDPGAATTGLTVTKVDATNWNVSLSLAGASKKLNVVLVPAGAFQFKFVADSLADSTVIGIGPDGGATPSFTITPKKVGSTTVMIRHQGFTGDADPFVKLTVTVTA